MYKKIKDKDEMLGANWIDTKAVQFVNEVYQEKHSDMRSAWKSFIKKEKKLGLKGKHISYKPFCKFYDDTLKVLLSVKSSINGDD